jgi:hypothetical protein
VISPVTDGHAHLRFLSQPLYPKVEAIAVSVVVARRANKLTSVLEERWRLNDPKDSDFFVGVTPPSRVTLWEWPRFVSVPTVRDLLGAEATKSHAGLPLLLRLPDGSEPKLLMLDCEPAAVIPFMRRLKSLAEESSNGIPKLDVQIPGSDITFQVEVGSASDAYPGKRVFTDLKFGNGATGSTKRIE